MVVAERIEYILKNKENGDVKAVSDYFSMKYTTVHDIIKGKFVGENGEKVLCHIEKIIEDRIKEKERLRKKYIAKLQK